MPLARRWAAGVIVCAVLAGCGGDSNDVAGCDGEGDRVSATFAATSPRGGPPAPGSLDQAVRLICDRARTIGIRASVRRRGSAEIEVGVEPERRDDLDTLTTRGRLAFYDWEPNVFGNPDVPFRDRARATRAAARARPRAERTDLPPAGPSDEVERRFGGDAKAIREHYDRQNDASGGEPSGIVVAAAEAPAQATPSAPGQFFVLEDDAELLNPDIEKIEQDFDQQTQEPILAIGLAESGKRAFARVTRRIAKRGQETLPRPGSAPADRFQRFAIVLDDRIVSLATIDFVANPEGISGSSGAQINGLGSIEDTMALAAVLRIGPLPVRLQRVR